MAAGTVTAQAAGLKLLLGTTSGDDSSVESVRAHTMATDKVFTAIARISLEDADKDGFFFGFCTDGTVEVFSAEPADGVYFESGVAAATLIGTVVSNAGTSADTATLATISDSVGGLTNTVEIGMQFCASTTAGKSWGQWWVDGTAVAFTAAQITALTAMVTTTAPSLSALIGARAGDTGADDVYVQYAWAGCDR